MGIKADALKVLQGIDKLSEAYSKAKGKPMIECSVTRAQWKAVDEAIRTEKIMNPGVNLDMRYYKDIELHIR